MNLRAIAGMAGLLMASGAMDSPKSYLDFEPSPSQREPYLYDSGTRPRKKSPLSGKQQKARAKAKAARKVRKR